MATATTFYSGTVTIAPGANVTINFTTFATAIQGIALTGFGPSGPSDGFVESVTNSSAVLGNGSDYPITCYWLAYGS